MALWLGWFLLYLLSLKTLHLTAIGSCGFDWGNKADGLQHPPRPPWAGGDSMNLLLSMIQALILGSWCSTGTGPQERCAISVLGRFEDWARKNQGWPHAVLETVCLWAGGWEEASEGLNFALFQFSVVVLWMKAVCLHDQWLRGFWNLCWATAQERKKKKPCGSRWFF